MPKEFKNYRDASRTNWGKKVEDGDEGSSMNRDDLKFGCMLRMADAAEKMALNYDTLINERDRYKRCYNEEKELVKQRDNSIRSLKGTITKLKKKAIKR